MAATTLLIGLLVAYANGANDNFKGVATLFGSGTTAYRGALIWATVTTALGSLTALVLASELLTAFSGRGLVPDELVADPAFPLAVAFGAGSTVLLAARLGFPISTTHALIGALVGVGFVRASGDVDVAALGDSFVAPLLVSPFLAVLVAAGLYPALGWVRRRSGVTEETCVCVGTEVVAVVDGRMAASEAVAAVAVAAPSVSVSDPVSCRTRYRGRMIGLSAGKLLDNAHYLSAGAVCFARGVNDTPKIAALLLVGSPLSPGLAVATVAAAIAIGGWLNARRVAETMAHRITEMTPGQGVTANMVTALLVIGASKLGLPVSTTHVSCGALFGIGATTRQAHWGTIGQIFLAWLVTLPCAAALGIVFASLSHHFA